MNIYGDNIMSVAQVIETQKQVPTRDDIITGEDSAKNHIWTPVSHSNFLEALMIGFDNHCIKVLNSSFGFNKKRGGEQGHTMVGGFELQGPCLPEMPGNLDANYQMFVRHANDMSLGMQLRGGFNLMVCTNGCMTGELIGSHKHTSGFDVYSWANDVAIDAFVEDCEKQVTHVRSLKETVCSEQQFDTIVRRALADEIMPAARVRDLVREWEKPRYSSEDFEHHTAWKAYGDMTYVAQKCSGDTHLRVLDKGSQLVRDVCGVDELCVINEAAVEEGSLF